MNNDFENLVAFFILAITEEKCGRKDIAMEYWNRIRSAGDIIESVASTEPEGLFEKE